MYVLHMRNSWYMPSCLAWVFYCVRVLLTAQAVIMHVPTVDIFTYAIDMFIA